MQKSFHIMFTLLPLLNFLNPGVSDVIKGDLDYTRLEFLGASCHPRDTCDRKFELPFDNRTCQCDSKCNLYDDCCINAHRTRYASSELSKPKFTCLANDMEVKGVYVISSCQRNYNLSDEVREKCENSSDMTDPWAAAPSTDIVQNITYKNRYCAECNNANLNNLRSWEINIECSDNITDSNYVQDHLTYITSGRYSNNWGFYFDDQFYPCKIPFRLPDELQNHVRFCRPNMVSTCDPAWRRKFHHDLCQSYTAVVYVDHTLFKNPDCAFCNMKNLENLWCGVPLQSVISRGKKPSLSFTLLLDVNTRDGNKVGEVRDTRCRNRQIWDPFFKKCRRLVCAIPGYVMRNNKCVRP